MGRCVACVLGKPLEVPAFAVGANGRRGWENIKLWFEGANAWPIKGYTPGVSAAREKYGLELASWSHASESENLKFVEQDDDIRYTIIGLIMLEEKGLVFDSWDIAKLWHRRLTYGSVCCSETQVYLNFARISSHQTLEKPADWEAKKEWVRSYLNPYREGIGAQIRADGWAYGVAGNPELAAELGYRDASLSTVKNGIYAEMLIAAMVSAAFVEEDMEKNIHIGLSEIPANCRMVPAVLKAMEVGKQATDIVQFASSVDKEFSHHRSTISDTARVIAALMFGQDDFEKAITSVVLSGGDTDCNGATVGSIMGAKLGAKAIPAYWSQPLNNTINSNIFGFHPITITECAERTFQVHRKLRSRAYVSLMF